MKEVQLTKIFKKDPRSTILNKVISFLSLLLVSRISSEKKSQKLSKLALLPVLELEWLLVITKSLPLLLLKNVALSMTKEKKMKIGYAWKDQNSAKKLEDLLIKKQRRTFSSWELMFLEKLLEILKT